MANQKLVAAVQLVMQDKGFSSWLLSIGKEGLKLIQELFLQTAKKDLKLAAMALEDPENTMILFAYSVYKQTQSKGSTPNAATEETLEYDDGLEDMNNPPLSNPISAKFGAKLKHISELNGHCPEGYELRYYQLGGGICGKCLKKKKLALLEDLKCGGKKRISKGAKGLSQARANSLKYKGGPGDINSTEGMKPNKKQKKMLCKKVGGMVNNAKKITIYQQPDMFDVIH